MKKAIIVVGILILLTGCSMLKESDLDIVIPPVEVSALMNSKYEVWAGGKDGVYVVDKETLKARRPFEKSKDLIYTKAIIKDNDDVIWIGCKKGLYRYSNDKLTQIIKDIQINDLFLANNGDVWAGTYKGAYRLKKDDIIEIVDKSDGLLCDMVNRIMIDDMGNIWFGSYIAPDGGISIMDSNRDISTFDNRNGLLHNNITAIIQNKNKVYVGQGLRNYGGACIFSFKNGKWFLDEKLTIDDGLAGEKVREIYIMGDILLYGSEYDGLAIFNNGEKTYLTTKDGLSNNEIKVIIEVEEDLFIGTLNGITVIPKKYFKR